MRPLTSPGRIAKGRLSPATSPPKRFVKPRVSSNHPFSDTLPLSSTLLWPALRAARRVLPHLQRRDEDDAERAGTNSAPCFPRWWPGLQAPSLAPPDLRQRRDAIHPLLCHSTTGNAPLGLLG